jgi:hypothetical protein
MKKTYIPLALIVLLLIFMSTGSLAIYTQSKTLRGQLYTRVFLFDASEKGTSYDLGLSGLALAPGGGEKELYRFELTNANGNSDVCDYNMAAAISSSGMSQALSSMDGLIFRLYDVTSESGTPVATVSSGELSKGGIIFRSGEKQTIQYRLTAEWNDTGNSAAQTQIAASGVSYAISLSVSAMSMN